MLNELERAKLHVINEQAWIVTFMLWKLIELTMLSDLESKRGNDATNCFRKINH